MPRKIRTGAKIVVACFGMQAHDIAVGGNATLPAPIGLPSSEDAEDVENR